MLRRNLILNADSYKDSHPFLLPEDVEFMHSYGEARGGETAGVIFFGLQGFILDNLLDPIALEDIDEAEDFAELHGEPFDRAMWETVLNDYGGLLPLDIRSIDEGMHVPVSTPFYSVENTDKRLPSLSGQVETMLVRDTWYAIAVASRLARFKAKIKPFYDQTAGGDYSSLPFAVLDFGSRGVPGYSASEIGGAAYLTAFMGSDNKPAIRFVNHYYGSKMSGFSIPATEHSVMCSYGSDGVETIKTLLTRAQCTGATALSIVSDTWNVFECAATIASMADEFRAAGIKAICRPDSGDMSKVLPEVARIIAGGFGTTRNGDNYNTINGAAVLQGDGIDEETVTIPFQIAKDMRLAAGSIFTGSGGGILLKGLTRDTHKHGYKASALKRVGQAEWEGIAKDPITDQGKRSKMGRHMSLLQDDRSWSVISGADVASYDAPRPRNQLRLRYLNGGVQNLTTIDEVRARVDEAISH